MPGRLPDVVIAGVNKAGTTSLFSYLTAHPRVCGSSVKETCYFLPIRYGRAAGPLDDYRAFFAACRDGQLAIEGTPGYFYGGTALASALAEAVPGVRVVIVLREPVSRLVSFFRFQQSMLNLPPDLTLAGYVQGCDGEDETSLMCDQTLNPWFGVLGGYYDRWLPAWIEAFGPRLRVLFADDLNGDPLAVLRSLGDWLDLDPTPWEALDTSRENATTGYRNRRLQQAALAANSGMERLWRRYPRLKQQLRSGYRRINAGDSSVGPDDELRAQLEDRYRAAMQQAAAQLRAAGVTQLPAWLS